MDCVINLGARIEEINVKTASQYCSTRSFEQLDEETRRYIVETCYECVNEIPESLREPFSEIDFKFVSDPFSEIEYMENFSEFESEIEKLKKIYPSLSLILDSLVFGEFYSVNSVTIHQYGSAVVRFNNLNPGSLQNHMLLSVEKIMDKSNPSTYPFFILFGLVFLFYSIYFAIV